MAVTDIPTRSNGETIEAAWFNTIKTEVQDEFDNLDNGFSQASLYSNGGFSTSIAASAFTINLKQSDGSTDPSTGSSSVRISFRSSTITSGAYNLRQVASATSITIPSGATLGTTSGDECKVYIYALDNAGTVELAVSSYLFDETELKSSTALSAAADDALILYSTNARSNVPIRCIGYFLSTQTTAGTWDANASSVSTSPISSTEQVYAFYRDNSGATVTSGNNFICGTKYVDSHNSYNSSTGVFTCRRSGLLKAKAAFTTSVDTTMADGEYVSLILKINGTSIIYGPRTTSTGTGNARWSYGFPGPLIPVSEGDLVTLVYENSVGSSITLLASTAYNWSSFEIV